MSVHSRFPERLPDQRDFFDALILEEWDYSNSEWDAVRRHEVALLFKRIQPRTILDVGCGRGFHDSVMAEYGFVHHVDAFDYSQKSIEKANLAYPHPKVNRFFAEMESYVSSLLYECVVSYQVIEHLTRANIYFEKTLPFLSPSGYLAIFTPNFNRLSNICNVLKGKPKTVCDSQHFMEFTASQLRVYGESAGLKCRYSTTYNLNGIDILNTMSINSRLNFGRYFSFLGIGAGLFMLFSKS